ncbi:hypothetical protein [Actinomadura geliboluensis]|uniref:hypothetical protein n=1 Tax=Actinomadura geliboluensis TaxID=882440 RepID=UPI00371EBB48
MTAPVEVRGYLLIEKAGVWFLEQDGRIAATIIDMGGGTWRARTPEGNARTFTIPPEVEDPPLYVAEQIA